MRTEILTFIISVTICLIGGVALAAYAIRSRSKERDCCGLGYSPCCTEPISFYGIPYFSSGSGAQMILLC